MIRGFSTRSKLSTRSSAPSCRKVRAGTATMATATANTMTAAHSTAPESAAPGHFWPESARIMKFCADVPSLLLDALLRVMEASTAGASRLIPEQVWMVLTSPNSNSSGESPRVPRARWCGRTPSYIQLRRCCATDACSISRHRPCNAIHRSKSDIAAISSGSSTTRRAPCHAARRFASRCCCPRTFTEHGRLEDVSRHAHSRHRLGGARGGLAHGQNSGVPRDRLHLSLGSGKIVGKA